MFSGAPPFFSLLGLNLKIKYIRKGGVYMYIGFFFCDRARLYPDQWITSELLGYARGENY